VTEAKKDTTPDVVSAGVHEQVIATWRERMAFAAAECDEARTERDEARQLIIDVRAVVEGQRDAATAERDAIGFQLDALRKRLALADEVIKAARGPFRRPDFDRVLAAYDAVPVAYDDETDAAMVTLLKDIFANKDGER
jgi:hypothetical protein